MKMKKGITFTYDELCRAVRSEKGNEDITDEEVYCCIEIYKYTGLIENVSKDIYRTTGKNP